MFITRKIHNVGACDFRPMLGTCDFLVGRDVYRATTALIRGLRVAAISGGPPQLSQEKQMDTGRVHQI